MIALVLPVQNNCHPDIPQRISENHPQPQKQLLEDLEGLKAHPEAAVSFACLISHHSTQVFPFRHPFKSWSSPFLIMGQGSGILWRVIGIKHGACRSEAEGLGSPHGIICNPNSRDRQREKHHLFFTDLQLGHGITDLKA